MAKYDTVGMELNLSRASDKFQTKVGAPLIPLTLKKGEVGCDHDGYWPPYGICVVFKAFDHEELLVGETGYLSMDHSEREKTRTVFLTKIDGHLKVFFVSEVSGWQLDVARPSLLASE